MVKFFKQTAFVALALSVCVSAAPTALSAAPAGISRDTANPIELFNLSDTLSHLGGRDDQVYKREMLRRKGGSSRCGSGGGGSTGSGSNGGGRATGGKREVLPRKGGSHGGSGVAHSSTGTGTGTGSNGGAGATGGKRDLADLD